MNTYLHLWIPSFCVFLIAIVMPVWDCFEVRKLRVSCTTRQRLNHYRTILLAHFALTAVSICYLGIQGILTAGQFLHAAERTLSNPALRWTLLGISLFFGGVALAPLAMGLINPKVRLAYTRTVSKASFAFMFPSTKTERSYFGILSISAGICEEIIFRSFLVAYFCSAPFGQSVFVALLISSALFGINHGYQGPAGIIKTGVGGFLFGLLYFATGSLLAAIVLHAITDLSVLYMFRPDLLQQYRDSVARRSEAEGLQPAANNS